MEPFLAVEGIADAGAHQTESAWMRMDLVVRCVPTSRTRPSGTRREGADGQERPEGIERGGALGNLFGPPPRYAEAATYKYWRAKTKYKLENIQ